MKALPRRPLLAEERLKHQYVTMSLGTIVTSLEAKYSPPHRRWSWGVWHGDRQRDFDFRSRCQRLWIVACNSGRVLTSSHGNHWGRCQIWQGFAIRPVIKNVSEDVTRARDQHVSYHSSPCHRGQLNLTLGELGRMYCDQTEPWPSVRDST